MNSESKISSHYRRGTRRGDRDACPTAEDLTALADASLPEPMRSMLLDHVSACSQCAEELALLTEVGSDLRELAAAAAGVHRPERARSRVSTAWPKLLAAAMLLLAVGTIWWQRLSVEPPAPERLRGVVADIVPANGASLTKLPERFAWPPAAVGAKYRLELLDADATRVWRSDWQAESQLQVGPGLAERLARDRTWLWQVRVSGFNGQNLLGPYWFELRGVEP